MFKKSVPYVQQMQETECGLCCVNMILKYYGSNASMAYLKNNFEIGRDGMSVKEIGDLLTQFNFEVDYYKSNIEGLKSVADTPTILFWDNVHFVVLEKIVNDKYYIVDPKIGKQIFDKSEIIEYYSNFVIKPKATPKLIKMKSNNKEEHIYYSFFSNNKSKAYVLMFLSLLAYLVALAAPVILQRVIDDLVKGDVNHSVQFLKIIVLLMIIYATVTYVRSIITISFSKLMDEYTYKSVIKKLFDLDFDSLK